jgi:hypothetical protein
MTWLLGKQKLRTWKYGVMSSGISNVIGRWNASAVLRELQWGNPLYPLTYTTSVGEYYLLGCNAVCFGRCPLRFRNSVLSSSSGSKSKQTENPVTSKRQKSTFHCKSFNTISCFVVWCILQHLHDVAQSVIKIKRKALYILSENIHTYTHTKITGSKNCILCRSWSISFENRDWDCLIWRTNTDIYCCKKGSILRSVMLWRSNSFVHVVSPTYIIWHCNL